MDQYFSSNSEANASELLENLEIKVPWCLESRSGIESATDILDIYEAFSLSN